jgi:hypothetical protein
VRARRGPCPGGRARSATARAMTALGLTALLAGACSSPATPSARPGGSGLGDELVALSFVDHRHGFGISEPQSANGLALPLEVVVTRDGGRSWRAVGPAPGKHALTARFVLHFMDVRNGFLRGSNGLFVTHDGGRTWAFQSLSGRVLAIASAGGRAWVGVTTCPSSPAGGYGGSGCTVGVEVSDDRGRTWAPLAGVPHAAYEGGEVVAESATAADFAAWRPAGPTGTGVLLTTTDGGTRWASAPLPCPDAYQLSGAFAIGGGTLWLACLGQGSGGTEGKVLYRSADAGGHWLAASGYALGGPTRSPGGAPVGSLEGLEAVTSSQAIVLTVNGGVQRSTDGGTTWQTVLPDVSGFRGVLTFADDRFGWVAAYTASASAPGLWHTSDGGAEWASIA